MSKTCRCRLAETFLIAMPKDARSVSTTTIMDTSDVIAGNCNNNLTSNKPRSPWLTQHPWLSFQEIIAAENYLYCFGMLVEFAAFIWLRIFHPNVHRPYRVPLGTMGIICMCIPPTALLLCMMVFATWKVTIISLVVAILGFAMYPCLAHVKQNDWVRFVVKPNVDDDAHIGLMNGEV